MPAAACSASHAELPPALGERLFRIRLRNSSAAEETMRALESENRLRIGDGRLRSTSAVADGAGSSAGAFWADAQVTVLDGREATAASADGVNGKHGRLDGVARDESFFGHGGCAFPNERDVTARSTMSKVMHEGNPALAAKMGTPTTPPAGPESSMPGPHAR